MAVTWQPRTSARCLVLSINLTRKRRPYGAQCVAVEGGAAAPGRSRCSRLRARLPARRTSGPTARAAFVFCARRPHCSARRSDRPRLKAPPSISHFATRGRPSGRHGRG